LRRGAQARARQLKLVDPAQQRRSVNAKRVYSYHPPLLLLANLRSFYFLFPPTF
jgi:hypothetical protein